MSGKILQVNFTFSVTAGEYEQAVAPLANEFARADGLRWKIWIVNAETREAGGILLFDDVEALNAFICGDLAAQVQNHPALSDFSVKVFDIMDEVTAVTRGPVELAHR